MIEIRTQDSTEHLSWEEWEARVGAGLIDPDTLVRSDILTAGAWRRADSLESWQHLRSHGELAAQYRFERAAMPWLTALGFGVMLRIWWVAHIPEAGQWITTHLMRSTADILENGEVWRTLTMGIVHRDMLHMGLNMLWFVYTGYYLERVLGRMNALVIFFGSVLCGSLLSTFASPYQPSLGASGGIFGMLSAMVVLGLTRPHLIPAVVKNRSFGLALLPYLLLIFLSGWRSDNTDNYSHLGGLLGGVLFALLADPPGLERSANWSRRWQSTFAVGATLGLAGLSLLGPRLVPLHTSARAERELLAGYGLSPPPDSRVHEFFYQVPAGWHKRPDPSGQMAWVSPAGPRTWSVTLLTRARPLDVSQILDDRRVALARNCDLSDISEFSTVELAGSEAYSQQATLTCEAQQLRWSAWVILRGTRALVVEWSTGSAQQAHLAPLRDRLLASIDWPLPAELLPLETKAREHPDQPVLQRELATLYERLGRAHEAFAIRSKLYHDNPSEKADAFALLSLLSLYPDAAPADPDLLAAILAKPFGTARYGAVADVLDAWGQSDTSIGLLSLAWRAAPGDVEIATARAQRRLPIALDDTGRPVADHYDPIALVYRHTPLALLTPDLGNARAEGVRLRQIQDLLLGRIASAFAQGDDPSLLRDLSSLSEGAPPEDPTRVVLSAQKAARLLVEAPPATLPTAFPAQAILTRLQSLSTSVSP